MKLKVYFKRNKNVCVLQNIESGCRRQSIMQFSKMNFQIDDEEAFIIALNKITR
jgi:hypothetical protein